MLEYTGMPGHSERKLISGQWLIPVGVSVTFLGMCSFYVAVSLPNQTVAALKTRHNILLAASEVALTVFMLLIPVGLLTTFVGSLIWAREGEPTSVLGVGLSIILLELLSGHFVRFSLHDWTALLMFIYLVGIVIAVLCLMLAFFRISNQ